ncbi:hypothetical protein [Brachyspira intermedia]|uniref:hypothetical protein n=1 Tax=Brachyspira intermedia TaxID=84377 RepID=UPI0030049982
MKKLLIILLGVIVISNVALADYTIDYPVYIIEYGSPIERIKKDIVNGISIAKQKNISDFCIKIELMSMTITEDNGLPSITEKDITDITKNLILYTISKLEELYEPYNNSYVIYEIYYDPYELILQLGWMGEH